MLGRRAGASRASRMRSRMASGTNSARKLAHYAISECSTKASPIWLWRFRAAAEQKTWSGARSRRGEQYMRGIAQTIGEFRQQTSGGASRAAQDPGARKGPPPATDHGCNCARVTARLEPL